MGHKVLRNTIVGIIKKDLQVPVPGAPSQRFLSPASCPLVQQASWGLSKRECRYNHSNTQGWGGMEWRTSAP